MIFKLFWVFRKFWKGGKEG